MLHLQAIFQYIIQILKVAYIITCEAIEKQSINLKLFPVSTKKFIVSFNIVISNI